MVIKMRTRKHYKSFVGMKPYSHVKPNQTNQIEPALMLLSFLPYTDLQEPFNMYFQTTIYANRFELALQ